MTFKCVSEGVPTPTLTWYKPDGNKLNTVTAKESTVEVKINGNQDFGEYKCVAYNGLDPFNDTLMSLEQISMCIHTFQTYRSTALKGDGLESLKSQRITYFLIHKLMSSLNLDNRN